MKGEYHFNVSLDSKIAIYSSGILGKEIADKLRGKNYKVCYMIDRNPLCCKYENIPIISLMEMEFLSNIEELIVFICLQNGLLHEDVAKMLYGYGINKIVYLPEGKPLEKMHEYRQIYRFMTMGEFEYMNDIPIYSPEKEHNLISKTEKSIVFWCSCEDLYVQKKSKKNPWENPDDYIDIKVKDADYYFDLFNFLIGENRRDGVIKYMKMQGYQTKEQQKEAIKDRTRLFETYEYAIKYDPFFFVDSPARSIYREKDTLYILDGVHRTVYLIMKGYNKVPVQVSKEDYLLYCANRGKVS